MKHVTAKSSDKEIMRAIDEVGDIPLRRNTNRPKEDWPENKNAKGWVLAKEIGFSGHYDQTLVRRLKKMVEAGLVQVRYNANMPRFRVKR